MINIQKIEYGRTISGSPLHAYMIKRKTVRKDTSQLTPKEESFYLRREAKPLLLPMVGVESKQKSIVVMGRW